MNTSEGRVPGGQGEASHQMLAPHGEGREVGEAPLGPGFMEEAIWKYVSHVSSLCHPPLPGLALVELWEQHKWPTPVFLASFAGPLETLCPWSLHMWHVWFWAKALSPKATLARMDLYGVHVSITVGHWGKPGQELNQAGKEAGKHGRMLVTSSL